MANAANPLVGIVMGSQSDWPVMEAAATTLEQLGIPYEARVLSAHRVPEETAAWASQAAGRGMKVLIAAAGGAAALPGVVAAQTLLPVVGVPMEGWALKGLDALLSMVQMPPGIPVGTVSIGKPGATNAALYAAQILAVEDAAVRASVAAYRRGRAEQILANPDPHEG
ncbi:MAG TPA: 5-(carboxyamino)imidazole ribonucleotide mutase [Dehalococcoidia bacterium]|nr:5-(carboxyamino)imidazole ribonucleotide mutase [Dehalococcoidia bacterium]